MNNEITVNASNEIIEKLVREFKDYVESQKEFDDVVENHFLSDALFADHNAFYSVLSTLLGAETYRNLVRKNRVLKMLGQEYDHRYDDGINALDKESLL